MGLGYGCKSVEKNFGEIFYDACLPCRSLGFHIDRDELAMCSFLPFPFFVAPPSTTAKVCTSSEVQLLVGHVSRA